VCRALLRCLSNQYLTLTRDNLAGGLSSGHGQPIAERLNAFPRI